MDLVDAFNQAGLFAKLSLLVGFTPLLAAIAYVVRPTERTLAFMRPISLAAIFAGICGLAAGFIAVLMGLAASQPDQTVMRAVYPGLAEALVPAFVNFGCLAAAWLLVAAGMLRRVA